MVTIYRTVTLTLTVTILKALFPSMSFISRDENVRREKILNDSTLENNSTKSSTVPLGKQVLMAVFTD